MSAPWLFATVCTNRAAEAARVAIEPAAAQAAAVEGAAALLITSGLDDEAHAAHERLAAEVGATARRAPAGLSAARNRALQGRGGRDVVAYLDDDAVPAPDWLARLAERWRAAGDEVACIGGPILPRWPAPPPRWVSERIWTAYSLMDLGPGLIEMEPERGRDVWGANVSFRAGPALAAGGFDPGRGPWGEVPMFGDESDLEIRLRAAGLRVLYAGDVRVEHLIGPERLTIGSLARRQYYRGLGAALSGRLSPGAGAARAARASAGLALALARRDLPLAGERLARVAAGAGAAASPLSRARLRRRGWRDPNRPAPPRPGAAPPRPGPAGDGASGPGHPDRPGDADRATAQASLVLVSPGGTGGWRTNETELAASLQRLGVAHEVVRSAPERGRRLLRAWQLGSLLVAAASRRAAIRALEQSPDVRALVMVNSTSALLLPWRRLRDAEVRVAVRIDAPATELWPGRSHLLQHRLERRTLRRADAILATGPRSAELLRGTGPPVIELPVPVEPSAPGAPGGSGPGVEVVAYAGQPAIKGLDRICRAVAALGAGAPRLGIAGVDAEQGRRFLERAGAPEPEGAVWLGTLQRGRYLELVASARAFVSASRMEGYGIAQLEALAAGVPLVTTEARGAYEAEPLARELAPELVVPAGDDAALATALQAALLLPPGRRSEYARRAVSLLAPFSRERADAGMREALALLGITR